DPERLKGNLALVSHPGTGHGNHRFWFKDWKVSGSKLAHNPDRSCGPVLSTQHTLSRGIMKMTAQMLPIGPEDTQEVTLEIQKGGRWQAVSSTRIIAPGYTATFRIEDWDPTQDWPYRVVYEMKQTDGKTQASIYSGKVRHDPVDKETIVLAAFTGNHNLGYGWGGVDSGHFPWTERTWFPHNDLTEKVAKHQPDVLFFSGDQVYESASPTAAQKSPVEKALLDYLYKWYLWCWAFRDLARDVPSISIPDDHDVYQGNLWGAGGRKTEMDNQGGYVMPPEWVNMVHRTQTSHLPDPFDPTPIEQGITVYYCNMNYGRIGFALVEDRKFKSGCAGLAPPTTSGRPDHVIDPEFDPRTADVPGAKLLGGRQLRFLEEWAADWKNTDMKAVLSQTVFANATSLHGAELQRLVVDYDSNGWPRQEETMPCENSGKHLLHTSRVTSIWPRSSIMESTTGTMLDGLSAFRLLPIFIPGPGCPSSPARTENRACRITRANSWMAWAILSPSGPLPIRESHPAENRLPFMTGCLATESSSSTRRNGRSLSSAGPDMPIPTTLEAEASIRDGP
ncbi:MAG: alkaline phosphatase D family protein, partial [Candidatus Aminicenantes bacterium]|nr:alkaline phosphatase D family protein [Candidatus Aminicenantes bacterium]